MLSVNNILAPKDGSPITTPTQDMILGSYYLTHEGEAVRNTPSDKGDGKIFADYDELLMAYQTGAVGVHAKVKVRKQLNSQDRGKLVESTVGRFLFNEEIPQDLGFVDRESDPYSWRSISCDKKKLGQIIDRCYRRHGNTETAKMLDHIKSTGFHYSTKAAITISIADMVMPESKKDIIDAAQTKVDAYQLAYRRGLMSNAERIDKVIEIWHKATDDVADALMESLGTLNNLYIMALRAGKQEPTKQIAGWRTDANATGKTIEIPITANFRKGLPSWNIFPATRPQRSG